MPTIRTRQVGPCCTTVHLQQHEATARSWSLAKRQTHATARNGSTLGHTLLHTISERRQPSHENLQARHQHTQHCTHRFCNHTPRASPPGSSLLTQPQSASATESLLTSSSGAEAIRSRANGTPRPTV